MITLYTFPETWELRNVSPYGIKVEMALTHPGENYQSVHESDPRKPPRGKMPHTVIDGESIADSEIIQEYLIAEEFPNVKAYAERVAQAVGVSARK